MAALDTVKGLLSQGYTAVTLPVTFNAETGKKKLGFTRSWKHVTSASALDFSDAKHNAVAILTEPSNMFVLDIDAIKLNEVGKFQDGLQLFDELVAQHGLSDTTPWQTTGSGGRHYFFSMSKCLQQGLKSDSNRAKIVINGSPTTIDARGKGGLIILAPSSYMANGQLLSYHMQVPIGPSDDLEAMPSWLIEIFNQAAATPSQTTLAKRKYATQLAVGDENISSIMRQVKPRVEAHIKNVVAHTYPRAGGMDFIVADKSIPCTICGNCHTSNSWLCRVIVDTCFSIRNYSTSCHLQVIDYKRQPILARILENPNCDDPFVLLLGARMASGNKQLRVTGAGKNFYCFNDHRWEQVPDTTIQQELRYIAYDVTNNLCIGLAGSIKQGRAQGQTIDGLEADRKQFAKAKAYVQKASNVTAITLSAKMLLWDQDLERKLDTNPDLLGIADGVIELKTGILRPGQPHDYISVSLDIEAGGCLSEPTPLIDSFFNDIFNSDAEMISYMQRLLGYAITGHTSEQVWAIWTGTGSNGKSLLISILHQLLDKVYVTMPRETMFDSGRKQVEGGPSSHLMTLIKKRIGVREEKQSAAILNEEAIKQVTGQSTITARGNYEKHYETFVATHLPILVCNTLPAVNCDDDAMLRRILVVPFTNVYTTPDDPIRPYNSSNPTHRIKDSTLQQKLLTIEAQQQLLSWLVKGAALWYERGLGSQPQVMRAELRAYISDNDKLTAFIHNSCEVDKSLHVNAASFREAYIADIGGKIKQDDLKKAMEKRGHIYKSIRQGPKMIKSYLGIGLSQIE